MTNFLLLNPDFFLTPAGQHKAKGSARALFLGWFLWPFFFFQIIF
jgi:hypothetical protein